MTPRLPSLPPGVTVFERGWLSANNILFQGPSGAALIDSGYATHADQTLALLNQALDGRPLDRLFNTHLHSDHCGGNAALQHRYPGLQTAIPPGEAPAIALWDEAALSYRSSGQLCPRFGFDSLLEPGTEVELAERRWQVHAAPGHDPHSALDLIEALDPLTIIPGHGAVFQGVGRALDTARRRLEGFVRDPDRHTLYAAKVLLKFKLLEWQQIALADFLAWAAATPLLHRMAQAQGGGQSAHDWAAQLVAQLQASGAARLEGGRLLNL